MAELQAFLEKTAGEPGAPEVLTGVAASLGGLKDKLVSKMVRLAEREIRRSPAYPRAGG